MIRLVSLIVILITALPSQAWFSHGGGGNAGPTATLSAATAVAAGWSDVRGTVTTDTASGTLYAIASTNTATPSATQIKTCKDQGNVTVVCSNVVVTSTGVKGPIKLGTTQSSALTSKTNYKIFYVQTTSADSNVVGATFTTGGKLTIVSHDGTGWTGNADRTTWETIWTNVVNELTAELSSFNDQTVDITRSYVTQSAAGASNWPLAQPSYATLKTALQGLPDQNTYQSAAFGALPGSDPTTGANGYAFPDALCRALGLSTGQGCAAAGGNTVAFTNSAGLFDLSLDGTTCAGGLVNLYGVIKHELAEILGRMEWADTFSNEHGVTDLFTYQSNGVRNNGFHNGQFRYLSQNGGANIIFQLNQGSSGDPGDTDPSTDGHFTPFAAFASSVFGKPANPVAGGNPLPQDDQYMTLNGYNLTEIGLTRAGL